MPFVAAKVEDVNVWATDFAQVEEHALLASTHGFVHNETVGGQALLPPKIRKRPEAANTARRNFFTDTLLAN